MTKHSQFPVGDYTPNSPVGIVLCSRRRPCKRIVECSFCREIRGDFICKSAEKAFSDYLDLGFLTLSYNSLPESNPWIPMRQTLKLISKTISQNKMRPYLCVLSRGIRGECHSHMILPGNHANALLEESRSNKWPLVKSRCLKYVCENEGGLFGLVRYFWQNAIDGFSDPERPKGTRVLRASRGLPLRFPTGQDWNYVSVKSASRDNQTGILFKKSSESIRKPPHRCSLKIEASEKLSSIE